MVTEIQPENSDSDLLLVLSELALEADCACRLNAILRRLGADDLFFDFRGLASVLTDIAAYAVSTGLQPQNSWIQLEAHVLELSEAFDTNSLLFPRPSRTARQGNPLGGSFDRYPVLSAIIQEPPAELLAASIAMKAVLVATCLDAWQPSWNPQEAHHLRLALAMGGSRQSFLAAMSTLSDSSLNVAAVRRQLDEQTPSRAADRGLSRLIRRLLDSLQNPSLMRQQPADSTETISSVLLGEDQVLSVSNFQTVDENEDEPLGELYAIDDMEFDETDENIAPRSVQGMEASGELSSYWLSIFHDAVQWDIAVLSPLEMHQLVSQLRSALTKTSENFSGALLSALSLVTGQDPSDVAAWTIGNDGTISPSGSYQKPIPAPQNAWKPKHEVLEYLEPHSDCLLLELPQLVKTALRSLDVGCASATLADTLGIDPEDAPKRIDKFLHVFKGTEFARISISKIHRTLRHRLALIETSPFVVFALSGTPTDQPPITAYYQSIKRDKAAKVYAAVTEAMFDSSS